MQELYTALGLLGLAIFVMGALLGVTFYEVTRREAEKSERRHDRIREVYTKEVLEAFHKSKHRMADAIKKGDAHIRGDSFSFREEEK